jgi:hypothetical protein
VKPCPNEKRLIKQKDLKEVEEKIKSQDHKENDKLHKHKRKK